MYQAIKSYAIYPDCVTINKVKLLYHNNYLFIQRNCVQIDIWDFGGTKCKQIIMNNYEYLYTHMLFYVHNTCK